MAARIRCAIYTRKSADERADAQLSTLDNQRDYCAAYVRSQGGAGWTEIPTRYDDGGYSGGTLRRPALTRLRADIAAGLVDAVVVYKIDRLSRSLRDFAALMGEFEGMGVTFAAVTQAMDTATSMGRLTLNVLLSFAQFERELTGERLRDFFAGARARGLWTTGRPPLGYRAERGRLTVDPAGSDLMRRIFRRYAALRSARLVALELAGSGALNHLGRPIRATYVLSKLHDRHCLGEIVHRGRWLPGGHEPIISRRLWGRVQAIMAESARRRALVRREPVPALLRGIIFGPSGHAMVLHFTRRRGRLYRYYVASPLHRRADAPCPVGRMRADDIEAAVLAKVMQLVHEPDLSRAGQVRPTLASDSAQLAWDAGYADADRAGLVRRVVDRVDVTLGGITLRLHAGGTAGVGPLR